MEMQHLCQAIIKTGKRSGEICLHKVLHKQTFCGYHTRTKHLEEDLRSDIISSLDNWIVNQTRAFREHDDKKCSLLSVEILNKQMENYTNKITTSLKNHLTYITTSLADSMETHYTHIMGCLTTYLDKQFQDVFKHIQRLENHISKTNTSVPIQYSGGLGNLHYTQSDHTSDLYTLQTTAHRSDSESPLRNETSQTKNPSFRCTYNSRHSI
jgi:hypothetical protein